MERSIHCLAFRRQTRGEDHARRANRRHRLFHLLMSMKPNTIPKPLNRITSSISDRSIPTVTITLYALSFESPTSRDSTAFWLHIRRSRFHVPPPHYSSLKVAGFGNNVCLAELGQQTVQQSHLFRGLSSSLLCFLPSCSRVLQNLSHKKNKARSFSLVILTRIVNIARMWIEREALCQQIETALGRSRIVALLGPRQCGKTALARHYATGKKTEYFDLEDPTDARRLENPLLALEPLDGLVVIDEIQRKPELFQLLRVLVDRQPLPARFFMWKSLG